MAEGTITRTRRDGVITIKDASRSYELAYEQGNLVINIPGPTVVLSLDRGQITDPPDIRLGDDQPMSGTFSARLRSASQTDVATLADFVTRGGYVSSTWVSTMGASAEVFTVTLDWLIQGSVIGEADETISCPYSWITGSVDESGDVAIVNCSFTSYALYPTIS